MEVEERIRQPKRIDEFRIITKINGNKMVEVFYGDEAFKQYCKAAKDFPDRYE